jgi:hypothetical protein
MPVALRTPLCGALGIDVPILSAGMGSVAGPDLVAGHRPGEGTSVGLIRLRSGETFELPRYSGTGSPLVGFDGDLDYPAMWAGESVEAVNDVRPAR